MALLPSLSTAAVAEELPLFSAKYDLLRYGITVGESRLALSRGEGDTFIYESRSRTRGVISLFLKDRIKERSEWRYEEHSIQPLRYLYLHSGGKKERRVQLSFDWVRQRVINDINGDAWQMPVEANTQDKLGYQLMMMRDLMQGKKEMEYVVADGGKLKVFSFAVDGTEPIETEIGRYETVRLVRRGGKRETTVWCASRLSYLPVRLYQKEKNGGLRKMVITSVRGLP
ncbi:MAG: DUF3108 domain-containing protein [Gammaproteobacteria bacterium]|nr:DUF3108 domain-containing protein [Gammaproteobacteria bacterium]